MALNLCYNKLENTEEAKIKPAVEPIPGSLGQGVFPFSPSATSPDGMQVLRRFIFPLPQHALAITLLERVDFKIYIYLLIFSLVNSLT